ncbi:precorrin-3B synthase [Devosia sp. BSSL-BM10]|uniref:Precorrin-3B synthase n=1 Tax=Devosia litorisediminis TaxID=2829817 RepID=A0A942I5P1_9HYPH|nr:precorrin-3B synthase [Devosia litorisediminis]MBS3849216.1 precorrin-3B synthase [Devosia litorisediminis]
MSAAQPIAAPSPRRRGACPTLEAPMQTGDGLLARLRVGEGRLTPAQLHTIAEQATHHGNGQVEITARGNLQVRGLTLTSTAPFATAVRAVVDIEQGLVVETPPLAGDDATEISAPRALAVSIRDLAAALGEQLGPKVTVVVDGMGQITRAGLKADIRLTAIAPQHWSLAIAEQPQSELHESAAAAAVVTVLHKLVELGPAARATDLVTPRASAAPSSSQTIGQFTLASGSATGIALPFGASDSPSLMALARLATDHGIAELRLAPHHTLLAINAPAGFVHDAAALGFITDASDPRTRISACIGSAGCASGLIPAREIAQQLASALPAGRDLHVSGCAKGCAHPRRAALTLVGQAGGYGLVINGSAGDTPQTVLHADQLESAIGPSGQG